MPPCPRTLTMRYRPSRPSSPGPSGGARKSVRLAFAAGAFASIETVASGSPIGGSVRESLKFASGDCASRPPHDSGIGVKIQSPMPAGWPEPGTGVSCPQTGHWTLLLGEVFLSAILVWHTGQAMAIMQDP